MTDTLELIDIDSLVDINISPQCEHSSHGRFVWHEGPASYVVRQFEVECGHAVPKTALICDAIWQVVGRDGVTCRNCQRNFKREDVWKIVEVL